MELIRQTNRENFLRIIKNAILGVILALGLFSISYGQIEDQKFSKKSGRIISKALKSQNAGNFDKALMQYNRLLKNTDLNTFEKSYTLMSKGHLHYQLDAYELTIESFQKAIDAGGLPEYQIETLEKQISSIERLMNKDYDAPSEKPKGNFSITPQVHPIQ